MTEGDILVPTTGAYPNPGLPKLGPLFTPTTLVPHGAGGLNLAAGCVGHPPGTPCWVEVDAWSRGLDGPARNFGFLPGEIWFSTDEFALGLPGVPAPPNVTTEAPAGEASADVFTNPFLTPPGPLPPFAGPAANVGVVDGDGFGIFAGRAYHGTGLREPNPPLPGPLAIGDELDAFDVDDLTGPGLLLYSLDAAFPDPLRMVPNSASAAFHGVFGGDILIGIPGAPAPVIWAPAVVLGLDRIGPPGSDDLDALAVWDNGDGVFQPSQVPYDWLGGQRDMVLFSVRRGSAVIGSPDSIFAMPIQPGDILTTPLIGGVSPFPGIFIAAENLGLATSRVMPGLMGDDLDALDLVRIPLYDCNASTIEDAVDIVGGALDTNLNGVPDVCEVGIGTAYCECTLPVSPCGNANPAGGCINAAGVGAGLTGAGTTSVAADNLVLTTTGMNPLGFALTFYGTVPVPPVRVQNGVLCANGTNYRLPPYPTLAGTAAIGPGIVAMSVFYHPPAGHISAGSTWHFQTWYRDVGGPCGAFSNFSNALAVLFTP